MFLAGHNVKYRPQVHIHKYPTMPVFLDLLDMDYKTTMYGTGLQASLNAVNSRAKEFIVGTHYPWLFNNSPYVTSIVSSRDSTLANHKHIKHYALNPHETYEQLTGKDHISYAWIKSFGHRNRCNPLPVYFNEYKKGDYVMVSLQNKEVENELCKHPNFFKCTENISESSFIKVLKAKAVICDDSHWAYVANNNALVIWYQYDYKKYGFDSHLNYYVSNCATPLCNRPMMGRKDKFECPYDYACKKQEGLLQLIEGNIDELLRVQDSQNTLFKKEKNEKTERDIFNWS